MTARRRHEWEKPIIRNYTAVVPCRNCWVVWWPGRNEPQSECQPIGDIHA